MNDDVSPGAQGPEAPPLPEMWIRMARSSYTPPGETPREIAIRNASRMREPDMDSAVRGESTRDIGTFFP